VALLSFLSSLVVAVVVAVAAVSAFWSGGTFPSMMYSSERRGRAIMNKCQLAIFYTLQDIQYYCNYVLIIYDTGMYQVIAFRNTIRSVERGFEDRPLFTVKRLYYTYSTIVSVSSSELAPPAPSPPKQVCPLPWNGGGGGGGGGNSCLGGVGGGGGTRAAGAKRTEP
jgi:hypothetical protein